MKFQSTSKCLINLISRSKNFESIARLPVISSRLFKPQALIGLQKSLQSFQLLLLLEIVFVQVSEVSKFTMSGVIRSKKNSLPSDLQVDYLISGPLEWKTLSSGDLYLIFLLSDIKQFLE